MYCLKITSKIPLAFFFEISKFIKKNLRNTAERFEMKDKKRIHKDKRAREYYRTATNSTQFVSSAKTILSEVPFVISFFPKR